MNAAATILFVLVVFGLACLLTRGSRGIGRIQQYHFMPFVS